MLKRIMGLMANRRQYFIIKIQVILFLFNLLQDLVILLASQRGFHNFLKNNDSIKDIKI